jgi:hypothetical protein
MIEFEMQIKRSCLGYWHWVTLLLGYWVITGLLGVSFFHWVCNGNLLGKRNFYWVSGLQCNETGLLGFYWLFHWVTGLLMAFPLG